MMGCNGWCACFMLGYKLLASKTGLIKQSRPSKWLPKKKKKVSRSSTDHLHDIPMSDVKGAEKPIITYCVEYAQSQTSKCATCNRTIPNKSLRCGEIFRRSKKEKKQLSKTTWYHFKCFPGKPLTPWQSFSYKKQLTDHPLPVPELLTKLPIEQFRGYPAVEEKVGSLGSNWGFF